MAQVKLGRRGVYTDGNGYQKAAIVIGTYDSIQDGTDVQRPAEGNVNVRVLSPTGDASKDYARFDIPVGAGPKAFNI